MDLSQYAELFLAESREHLSACNQLLLDWERSPANLAPVGGLFRAVHTVKGMAATMGYARVTDLAHRAENLLDLVRRGARPATDDLLQLLFRGREALEHAVELSVAGREDEIDVAEVVADLEGAAAHLGPHPLAPSPRSGEGERVGEVPPAAAGRLVQVTLRAEAPLKGGRALLVIKKAQAVGPVHAVTPPESAFEADEFDGRFSFRIGGAAGVAEIERAVRAAGEVEHVTVGGEERRPAPGAGALPAAPETKSRHIRVDLGRLDGLMDLIGELVTVRGRLNELAAYARDPAIDDVAIQVSRLSRELQAEIIQARMTPVWQVFDRFPRLVRDLARELGKQVAFRVEGKEIELDRAILDELGDPLLHLLRNAVDHGVELPADRRRRGKKPEGEIVLAAVRERASVAISVRDDGRGIDRKQILERARRDGVVDAHAEALTDDQLLRVLARNPLGTGDGHDLRDAAAGHAGDRARADRGRGRGTLRAAAHLRVGNGGVRRSGHDHRGGPRGDRAARPRRAARAPETLARRERGRADSVSHHRARDGGAAQRHRGGRDAGPAGDRRKGVRRTPRDAAGVQRGDDHGRRGSRVDSRRGRAPVGEAAWKTCGISKSCRSTRCARWRTSARATPPPHCRSSRTARA